MPAIGIGNLWLHVRCCKFFLQLARTQDKILVWVWGGLQTPQTSTRSRGAEISVNADGFWSSLETYCCMPRVGRGGVIINMYVCKYVNIDVYIYICIYIVYMRNHIFSAVFFPSASSSFPPSFASFLPSASSFLPSPFPLSLLPFYAHLTPRPNQKHQTCPTNTPSRKKCAEVLLQTNCYQAAAKTRFGNVIQPTGQLDEPWLTTAQTLRKTQKDHDGRDATVNPLERPVACGRCQSSMVNCRLQMVCTPRENLAKGQGLDSLAGRLHDNWQRFRKPGGGSNSQERLWDFREAHELFKLKQIYPQSLCLNCVY